MLYFLTNPKKQGHWVEELPRLYMRWLEELGIETSILTSRKQLKKLKATDWVFLLHHEDIDTDTREMTKAGLVAQINGTSAGLYTGIDSVDEAMQVDEVVDVNLAFNERVKYAFNQKFPEAYCVVTGFPVDMNTWIKEIGVQKKPKTIIVPGRIAPEKQFYLSAFLLRPLLKEGYKIKFTYPSQKHDEELKRLGKQNFIEEGFEFELIEDHDKMLRELAGTEFYFSASLFETCSVSLTEALICGCYPIVPKFGWGLPTHDDYVSVGYEPFSQQSVLNLIRTKPPFEYDLDMQVPLSCAHRLAFYLRL